jgi:hypothetical protein
LQTVRIESADDPRLDTYVRLTDHQLRNKLEPEKGVLIAESRLVVEVALDAGLAPLSFLVDDARLESCADLIERAGRVCKRSSRCFSALATLPFSKTLST